MNITLSIPPAIVQEAREIADRNCTSLNRMIRDFLGEKIRAERERRRREADEVYAYFSNLHGKVPKGWKFDREEANSR